MARSDAVWGIDIGQCSLKALRCRAGDTPDTVIADAFDFIEYPKILSQPDAEPAELISEALKLFLSRNSVRGDRVAISVSGQNGLARFIRLPPVESKKIPDIVRYEARQQIPFDLDDVVWDYQRMGISSEEEGFALETEIGLFAMKRDQVFRALKPLRDAGIEVDHVQLTPLALYNYVAFDQLTDLPPPEEYDPDNPPASVVVLSLGTDATDLVITNGYRVWQRSIPIGGNHFTKALTKDKKLKLTFAKAEHLKRNATAADDPKAVFQAMQGVFNDLLTEIQRSIGYFTSLDRAAKIERVVALGNGMKLPALRRFLSRGLGFDVTRADSFRGITGPEVLAAPAFKENSLSFAVCYGLCLQGLDMGVLKTNLLPSEIVKDRLIREKKPWAVGAAALLLLACTVSFTSWSLALATVDEDLFSSAERQANQVVNEAKQYKSDAEAAKEEFATTQEIGQHLVGNVEGRRLWLELLRAINDSLPSDPPGKRPEEIMLRNELHITSVEAWRTAKLENWFATMTMNNWYVPPTPEEEPAPTAAGPEGAEAAGTEAAPAGAEAAPVGAVDATGGEGEGDEADAEGPEGEGWVIQLTGYHFHNRERAGGNQGAEYVRRTLIENLRDGQILLPTGEWDENGEEKVEMVPVSDLGIGYPVLINPGKVETVLVANPNAEPETAEGAEGADPMQPGVAGRMEAGQAGENQAPSRIELRKFDFVVQFAWKPTPPSERHEKEEQAEESAEEEQAF